MADLLGRRAIVTGAASGIGRACLEAFRSAGAVAVGLDLVGEGMVRVDVADEASVTRAVAEAAARLGGVDVLVNSAGIEIDGELRSLDVRDLDRMYAVNVRGPVLVTRAVLPFLGEGSRVINIASELAYLGRAGASGYCATKGAVLSLTRSWARELAPRVLVNAIAPGPIDTPLLHFESLAPEAKRLELANPLGRIGRPEEVAAVAVFLAGAGSSFVTGQCFGVDGGAAMR